MATLASKLKFKMDQVNSGSPLKKSNGEAEPSPYDEGQIKQTEDKVRKVQWGCNATNDEDNTGYTGKIPVGQWKAEKERFQEKMLATDRASIDERMPEEVSICSYEWECVGYVKYPASARLGSVMNLICVR